jgi:hypothetical protein
MECFLQRNKRHSGVAYARGQSMDPKLAILFVLISVVIALSHLSEENLGRMRRQLINRRWRPFALSRRKS